MMDGDDAGSTVAPLLPGSWGSPVLFKECGTEEQGAPNAGESVSGSVSS